MAATQTASAGAQFGRVGSAPGKLFGGMRRKASSAVETYTDQREVAESRYEDRLNQSMLGTVRGVGAAVITIAVIALVANEVLTVGAINNSTGPFAPVVDQLGTTGVAAMGLLIVGLIVAAAAVIMRMMEGGF